ncbi:MAG TPA: hypothetical protein PLT82_07890 [Candidatus Hydrogenedens sp.]|nr:hypothetical protein [Candidatus Hydrogenedens sp.]
MKHFCIFLQITHFFIVIVASYIFALYLEPIIYMLGFLPLEIGNTFCVYITLMATFCVFQFLFRAMIQLLFSAPLNLTTVIDILSFLPCFILIAHITGYISHIPNVPTQLIPFAFLGIFLGTHLFLKLIVLFASIYGKANSRWFSMFWFFAMLIIAYIALAGLIQWKNELIVHRFFQVKEPIPVDNNNNVTFATEVPEMSFYLQPTTFKEHTEYTWFIRAGNRFSSTSEIHIYLICPYKNTKPQIITTPVFKDQWIELCLPEIAVDSSNFILVWSMHRFPSELIRHGLVPQLSFSSLEDIREFLFSDKKEEIKLFKTIYIDGPYCSKEVSGEVSILK